MTGPAATMPAWRGAAEFVAAFCGAVAAGFWWGADAELDAVQHEEGSRVRVPRARVRRRRRGVRRLRVFGRRSSLRQVPGRPGEAVQAVQDGGLDLSFAELAVGVGHEQGLAGLEQQHPELLSCGGVIDAGLWVQPDGAEAEGGIVDEGGAALGVEGRA